ncbi:uncharacterized protein EV420DRAFT_1752755 [Desarmillaria tabescens]|uniref:Uncharacterized protein n=1 Tax=Armillaria tabescens TaxID=1929756 RepID=A0AA39MNH0_ARMTA|nr:uncharacterized protein EV420DRAFT_1752755 [Desarmillaria tabescens]KAK0440194.1 hypothetical protein EV420DRAFT_1752755 [Desarmillaria tabescens]
MSLSLSEFSQVFRDWKGHVARSELIQVHRSCGDAPARKAKILVRVKKGGREHHGSGQEGDAETALASFYFWITLIFDLYSTRVFFMRFIPRQKAETQITVLWRPLLGWNCNDRSCFSEMLVVAIKESFWIDALALITH